MRSALLIVLLAAATPAPTRPYHVVHGWPDLPTGTDLHEITGVAVDAHRHVFVLTRGGRPWPDNDALDDKPIARATVFMLDGGTGKLLGQWGEQRFALPHHIAVDSRDHVWVTDVAWHQVFEFTHDGLPVRALGVRGVPGSDESHFNRPAGVAVAPDGAIYVSDGYGNDRVVKFAADGRFVRQWGSKGTTQGQFDLPHAIAIDREGRVMVVDRGNKRIQVFDAGGAFLAEWKGAHFASPQAIAASADGLVYVAEGGSETPPDPCGIVILDREGILRGRAGRFGYYDGQFADPHGIAVASSGDVFVADFEGKRVQKFVR